MEEKKRKKERIKGKVKKIENKREEREEAMCVEEKIRRNMLS